MPLSLHAMGRTMILLLAFATCLTAHEPAKPIGAAGGPASSALPELPYRLVPDWLRPAARLEPGRNRGGGHRCPRPHLRLPSWPASAAGIRTQRGIGARNRRGAVVSAHGVEVDPQGNIWAVDVEGHMVLKFNRSGRVEMVLGKKGLAKSDDEFFDRPTDIGFAPNGDIYVTDGYGNSRVMKFSPDGRLLKKWGKKGTGPGEFDTPHSVAVDAKGLVYIADRENNASRFSTLTASSYANGRIWARPGAWRLRRTSTST